MRLTASLILCLLIYSCSTKDHRPDVSNISVQVATRHFERDLFSADTLQLAESLAKLKQTYPQFFDIFLYSILNAHRYDSFDSTVQYVKGFVSSYRSLYDSCQEKFEQFGKYEEEIKQALKYLKYYFPKYQLPSELITYIGPIDGYGDILTENALIIGLHHHLGGTSQFYQSSWVQDTYPSYLTARFEPEYIQVNCMKNIIDDMYPEIVEEGTLIQKMIHAGQRLYVLQKLLPDCTENVLIGYRDDQMKDCYQHEAVIWNFFIQNNLLQSNDKNVMKDYVSEGPKTPELGENAPGNIGSFIGWQMVKKYMNNNEGLSLEKLMQTNAEDIVKEARYKP